MIDPKDFKALNIQAVNELIAAGLDVKSNIEFNLYRYTIPRSIRLRAPDFIDSSGERGSHPSTL